MQKEIYPASDIDHRREKLCAIDTIGPLRRLVGRRAIGRGGSLGQFQNRLQK